MFTILKNLVRSAKEETQMGLRSQRVALTATVTKFAVVAALGLVAGVLAALLVVVIGGCLLYVIGRDVSGGRQWVGLLFAGGYLLLLLVATALFALIFWQNKTSEAAVEQREAKIATGNAAANLEAIPQALLTKYPWAVALAVAGTGLVFWKVPAVRRNAVKSVVGLGSTALVPLATHLIASLTAKNRLAEMERNPNVMPSARMRERPAATV